MKFIVPENHGSRKPDVCKEACEGRKVWQERIPPLTNADETAPPSRQALPRSPWPPARLLSAFALHTDSRSSQAAVQKVINILAFLLSMQTEDELRALPNWKPHQMTGDRKGVWALHVTKKLKLST